MPELDAEALRAYRLLQAGEHRKARVLLEQLVPAAGDRPKLAGRLCAWAAQACLALQDPKPARRHLSAALRLARTTDDADALQALAPLQQAVFAAMTAAARPPQEPQTPAAHAVAAYDAGDAERGERLARDARRLAQASGDAKEEVVALLALARSPGLAQTVLREAAVVADTSGDRNLVTAVAKACRAAGVDLGAKVF